MTKEVKVEVEVQLSHDERTEKARESVRMSKELDTLDGQFKEARADWRRRLKHVKDTRDKLNDAFMVGSEVREMLCIEIYDAPRKTFQYVHAGKVIREREASLEEQAREGTAPMFPDDDVADVMRDETSKKRKKAPV